MNNFRDRRPNGGGSRGKSERASFNPNFSVDNKLKRRFNGNSEERPQYGRASRDGEARTGYTNRRSYDRNARDFEGNRFGGERGSYGRYANDSKPSYGENRVGNYRKNNYRGGNEAAGEYGVERRNNYGNRPNRKGAYDPNAKYSAKKRAAYKEAMLDPNAPLRLNKFLSNAGICSRREADNYIEAGLITVNGVVVTELGTKVTPNDDVRFNGERINPERKVYVLLNKPKDCVTTVDDPQERKTVLDCLRGIGKERIYPVGRLDRNTTGVLLLTNDGDMAAKLTHPKFMKKKIYHVTCDKNVAMSDMDLLVNGIELEDGHVYADEVTYVNEADRSQIGIEIHSGKNRIVRRMLEHLGYRVNKLDRVLFAGLTKKNLRRGDWRYLTDKEVNMLRMGAYE